MSFTTEYRCRDCNVTFTSNEIIAICPICAKGGFHLEKIRVISVTEKDLMQPDIVDKYLLNIKIPRDSAVPLEVYIAFPKTLTDEIERRNVRQWWLYGNSKEILGMDLITKQKVEAIFRPSGVAIDWQNVLVGVQMPSGYMVVVPLRLLEYLGTTTEERIANLSDYIYMTIKKVEGNLIAETVLPLRGKVENEIAHNIMVESHYTPLELILMGLGYQPIHDVKRLFLPRVVTWFKGYDGKNMHVAQFTQPESGKTTFAIRNETLWNWGYIQEPPTLARLILNAQMGILGEVFQRNGICFDEFEKWTLDTTDRQYTFYTLLTGMEQGKWSRGVSARGIKPPDIPRFIPILFFGNLGDFRKYEGVRPYVARALFTNIFEQRFGQDTTALADRICMIDTVFQEIRVMDYLTYRVLPDAVIRGIVSECQKKVKEYSVSRLKGRFKRHSECLFAIVNALGVNVTGEDTDAMVIGTYDWKQLGTRTKEEVQYVMETSVSVTPTKEDKEKEEAEAKAIEEKMKALRDGVGET